jgi:hypothetical protein
MKKTKSIMKLTIIHKDVKQPPDKSQPLPHLSPNLLMSPHKLLNQNLHLYWKLLLTQKPNKK